MNETVLTDTYRFQNVNGQTYIPTAPFVWRGPANVPVFALENCRDVVMSGVDVTLENPAEAVVIVERTNNDPGTIPSTMLGFHRWRIYNPHGGDRCRGFWYRSTIDANNEHGEFHACTLNDIAYPFEFEGQQSKEHRITHCRIDGAVEGIRASSSFMLEGGTIARATVGVNLTRCGDPVKITGTGFEAVGRILMTDGPTTAAQPVTLDSIRYEADQLAPDGDCIVMRHAGPLNLTGSRIGGGQQRIPRIALLGHGDQLAVIQGNYFGAFGAYRVCPIRAVNAAVAQVDWGWNRFQRQANADPNTDIQRTWSRSSYV